MSLSWIVSTAAACAPMVAPPVGLPSVRLTASSPSTSASSTIGTCTVFVVSPVAKLTGNEVPV